MIPEPQEDSGETEPLPEEDSLAQPAAEYPLGEPTLYMVGDIPEMLTDRLRLGLDRVGLRTQLALFGRLQELTVRAADTAAPAGRLELPSAGTPLLGAELETHVLAEAGRILFWIAGAEKIDPGSQLILIAINDEGEPAQTMVHVNDPSETIELSLPWTSPSPQAIALVIERMRTRKGTAD